MVQVRALVVCTGNTCRSPIGAALLAHRLAQHGLTADVASAGTLGWSARPATVHARTAAADWGLDLGDHVSRRLEPTHLAVDLVVAMTRDHAGAVVARDASLAPCVFLPGEFARLAEGTGARQDQETTRDYVERVGAGRSAGPIGRAAEEIPDPAGEPLATYRRVARRLDRDLTVLAAALAGVGSDPVTAAVHDPEDRRW